jgi:hypothetical protein
METAIKVALVTGVISLFGIILSNILNDNGGPSEMLDQNSMANPPSIVFPGSRSEPGDIINTLTPTFIWKEDFKADYYALFISKYPYGEANLIFNSKTDYGPINASPFKLPDGYLHNGTKYRWNMQAHSISGWSKYSIPFNFQASIISNGGV